MKNVMCTKIAAAAVALYVPDKIDVKRAEQIRFAHAPSV
jgi:hypothetical protein